MEFAGPVILFRDEVLDVGNNFKWVPLSQDRFMLNPTANMSSVQELQVYKLMQDAAQQQIPIQHMTPNTAEAPAEVWEALAERAAQEPQFEKFAHLAKIEEAERLFLLGAASAPTHNPQLLTRRLRALGLPLSGTHAKRQARLHAALQQSIPATTVNSFFKMIGAKATYKSSTLAEKHAFIAALFTGDKSHVQTWPQFNSEIGDFEQWSREKLASIPFGARVYSTHRSPQYQRPHAVTEPTCTTCFTQEALCACNTTEAAFADRGITEAMNDMTKHRPELLSGSSQDAKHFVLVMEKFRLSRFQGEARAENLRKALREFGFAPLSAENATEAIAGYALECFAKKHVSVADVQAIGFRSVNDWVKDW